MAGQTPRAVIRDPARAKNIVLPVADREQLTEGLPLEALLNDPVLRARLRGFIFQDGQPDEIRQAFVEAMGVADIDLRSIGPVDLLARG
jgi:5,5'-dehydrodivanillate O-demethylase